ncbi:MAG: molybdenum cofactor guanylyltransferase [Thermoplasmata archaeon]|jgi:molybdopterin-guanine dinucleotide biosynthesis protein A|nr:molybdenum cofactor guanylyltransferase [Thermoplasmatales archaeon]
MVIALVPVGNSKRLKNKHFLDFCGKRIIDAVIDNLEETGAFSRIIVYSHADIRVKNAEVIRDERLEGVLPLIFDAIRRYGENVFVLGGDMPLANRSSILPLLSYPEQLSVVPRWRNGYMEPLHSLYSTSCINYEPEGRSINRFIERIPRIYFPAEDLPPNAFFNVNTQEDYERLKNLCRGNL